MVFPPSIGGNTITDLFRRFEVQSRKLTAAQKTYGGQVNDALSTTLHIEYDPVNWLSNDSYSPFIMFNIMGPRGQPYTYSIASNPKFDGYSFELPFEITSQVKNGALEYQLFFLKNKTQWNGDFDELVGTEYLHSNIDRLVVRPGIQPSKKCSASASMLPYTEPNIAGWIEYFKEYGAILPMHAEMDEDKDRIQLVFRTYNGNQMCFVTIDAPHFDENGKIPHRFLDIIRRWGSESDDNLPSAKLVFDSLAEKTDKSRAIDDWSPDREYDTGAVVLGPDLTIFRSLRDGNVGSEPLEGSPDWSQIVDIDILVKSWSPEPSDLKVPTEKLIKDSLDAKLDDAQIIVSWGDSSREGAIPSASLVKDSLDAKLDRAQLIDAWGIAPSALRIPSARLVKQDLDSKMDDSQVVETWDSLASGIQVPEAKLVKDSLDSKTDVLEAIPKWDPQVEYRIGSTVWEGESVYIAIKVPSIGDAPNNNPDYWKLVGDGSGDGSTLEESAFYKGHIGDGSGVEYIVSHNLHTPDIFVELYSELTKLYLHASIRVIDDDSILITTAKPIGLNEVTVIIATRAGSKSSHKQVIENPTGTAVDFTIYHNLHTTDFFYRVRSDAGDFVEVILESLDRDTAVLHFADPPEDRELTIYMAPYFSEIEVAPSEPPAPPVVEERYKVFHQTVPTDVWYIDHDLGRMVSAYITDLDGKQMEGTTVQDVNEHRWIEVHFAEPVAGYAYVR